MTDNLKIIEEMAKENRRLRAEIERLTAEHDAYRESNERLAAIVSGKNAEIERLTTLLPKYAAEIANQYAEIERLRAALQNLINDVLEYERINNLAPNPGKQDCWQSVTEARRALEPKP